MMKQALIGMVVGLLAGFGGHAWAGSLFTSPIGANGLVEVDIPSGVIRHFIPTWRSPQSGMGGLAVSDTELFSYGDPGPATDANGVQAPPTIRVIDRNSRTIRRDLPFPDGLVGAEGLAFVNGELIILDALTQTVVRVDPVDGTELGRCQPDLPEGPLAGGLAGGAGRLFSVVTNTVWRTLGIVELNPVSCAAIGTTLPMDSTSNWGLAFDGNLLYVSNFFAHIILMIDPVTGMRVGSMPSEPFALIALAASVDTPSLMISPPSGVYSETQEGDLVLIIDHALIAPAGISAWLDGTDWSQEMNACLTADLSTDGGTLLRCHDFFEEVVGAGVHELQITVTQYDGSPLTRSVTWDIRGAQKPDKAYDNDDD